MFESAIANVHRIDIITEEDTPVLITMDTSDEVGIEAVVSEGDETEKRVKNTIIAQNMTEDIVKGYDLTVKDAVLSPKPFALTDGGAATYNTAEDKYHYTGPQLGSALSRTRFVMDVWTEEKDVDGEVTGYVRFRFRHCKGSPVKFSIKDGEFFTPEYTIKSRARKNESPIDIMNFDPDMLPAVTSTAAELLAYTTQEAPAG